MDRNLRFQLMDAILRPAQVRNFREQLNQTLAAADSRTNIQGRFQWLKRTLARILRPLQAQQVTFNHQVGDRLAELYDFIVSLMNTKSDIMTLVSAELRERLEQLRTEMFLELRSLVPSQAGVEEVRACATLRSLGEAPRLYLGSDGLKYQGYLTIDTVPGPNVELVCPLDRLPIKPGTVVEIVASHVVERYPSVELARRLLPHWVSMLREDGKLVLITNDVEAAVDCLKAGLIDPKEFLRCIFGPQARATDSYRSAYTPSLLAGVVSSCGLHQIGISSRRRNLDELTFDFTLEAHRSAMSIAA